MANIIDKDILNIPYDEDQIMQKASVAPQTYDAKIRDSIMNMGRNYGVTNDMIGWYKNNDTGSNGMVTFGGQDFYKPDSLQDGVSYGNYDKIKSAFDAYAKENKLLDLSQPTNFGYTKPTTDLSDPANYGYTKPTTDFGDAKNFGYSDRFRTTIDALLKSIMESGPFAYDSNKDQSFQAMKGQYGALGDKALANTMAGASETTGGRLNSWAVSAGQQAKSDYDSKLMNLLPQFEQNAYSRFLDDKQDKRSNLDIYRNLDNDDYRKAMEKGGIAANADKENYNRAMDRGGLAIDADKTSYQRSQDSANMTRNLLNDSNADKRVREGMLRDDARNKIEDIKWDKTFNNTLDRQKVEDERYNQTWDYNLKQDIIKNEQWVKTFNLGLAKMKQDATQHSNSIAVSLRNAKLNEDEFAYKKEMDKLAKETESDPQILGAIYSHMYSGVITDENGKTIKSNVTPKDWLIANGRLLDNKTALAAIQMLPKEDADIIQQLFDKMNFGTNVTIPNTND